MYLIPELATFTFIKHAFSTKDDGNMSFRWGDRESVLNNRKKFLSKVDIDMNDCVALHIQDKDLISVVDIKNKGSGMESMDSALLFDGIITRDKNLFLFLVIGDCLPIIVFDKNKNVGLIHAGWKSTEVKIAQKAIEKFTVEFNSNTKDIYTAIGPAIHKDSYRFKDPISKSFPGWEPFLKDYPNGETGIDLVGYNVNQLIKSKVLEEHIFVSSVNTATNTNFFSHYRDSKENPQEEGRFACVVGIA